MIHHKRLLSKPKPICRSTKLTSQYPKFMVAHQLFPAQLSEIQVPLPIGNRYKSSSVQKCVWISPIKSQSLQSVLHGIRDVNIKARPKGTSQNRFIPFHQRLSLILNQTPQRITSFASIQVTTIYSCHAATAQAISLFRFVGGHPPIVAEGTSTTPTLAESLLCST